MSLEDFDPKVIFDGTMTVAVTPMQNQIAIRMIEEVSKIIDDEGIIRSGTYRESIVPLNIPTNEDPDVSIASVLPPVGKDGKIINAPYNRFLEYGTTKMKPRKVFTRAIERVREVLNSI